jgi:hypothetical protein
MNCTLCIALSELPFSTLIPDLPRFLRRQISVWYQPTIGWRSRSRVAVQRESRLVFRLAKSGKVVGFLMSNAWAYRKMEPITE